MTYVERLCRLAYWTVIIVAGAIVVDQVVGLGWYDSTDDGRHRSGLALRADAGTGCEYLVASGGITPRLRPDGRQSGCRQ